MRISNVLKVALFAPLVALASAQRVDQILSAPTPAGKPYNLSTLQSYFYEVYLGAQLTGYVCGNPNMTISGPTDTAFTSAIALLGGQNNVLPLSALYANKLSFIPTLLGNELTSVKSQVVKVEVDLLKVTALEVALSIFSKSVSVGVTSKRVLHVADGVLIPPLNVSTILTNLNALNDPALSFKQLASALDSQNLTEGFFAIIGGFGVVASLLFVRSSVRE